MAGAFYVRDRGEHRQAAGASAEGLEWRAMSDLLRQVLIFRRGSRASSSHATAGATK